MNKKYLILLVLFILAALFFIGFIPRLANEQEIERIANQRDAPKVVTQNITPNIDPSKLVLPTTAQGWHFTPIWARVNGYVLRFLVDIGDSVKQGDLLAELDTPETDQELARAKADLQNAIAERDIAKVTSDRWNALWNKNQEAVSKQEVDQYAANLKSAEAIVLVNERNVDRLTYEMQFKYIYAPFDGVITRRSIDIGTLVYGNLNGAPQELFELAQSGIVRFFVQVPQNYFTEIQDGLDVEVRVNEFQGTIFTGKVARFAKALDPQARTLNTQIDVENKNNLLYPGIYGTATFTLKPRPGTFTIPTTAVIVRSSAPQVAIVDQDNIARFKTIRIGRDFGNKMEIIHGLKTNDRIITLPSDNIHDGTKVEVIQ